MTPCVLDTDVLIAALDRADAHHLAAAAAITALTEEGAALLMSVVNYAEALVRPAADEASLRAAIRAIDALGIDLISPTPAIGRDAAQLRGLGISLADGFALATAKARGASLASLDHRVRRALEVAGIEPEQQLS